MLMYGRAQSARRRVLQRKPDVLARFRGMESVRWKDQACRPLQTHPAGRRKCVPRNTKSYTVLTWTARVGIFHDAVTENSTLMLQSNGSTRVGVGRQVLSATNSFERFCRAMKGTLIYVAVCFSSTHTINHLSGEQSRTVAPKLARMMGTLRMVVVVAKRLHYQALRLFRLSCERVLLRLYAGTRRTVHQTQRPENVCGWISCGSDPPSQYSFEECAEGLRAALSHTFGYHLLMLPSSICLDLSRRS